MDKYEYKLRSDEIMSLIKKQEYQRAVEIADTIDWTRVRSVTTLCTISDLYKINRRYNEARILLEQAYNRYPNSKKILYSLCELCIKMDDVVAAMEYYKMFVQMAPTENGKFILLYKLYEAQDASLEERIECLEEFKKRDRQEKWCYELAYLYHRIGLTTKCVEECDELVLWFREGKYVKKAMELKMLHQPLTTNQEQLYRNMLSPKEREEYADQNVTHEATDERVPEQVDEIQVKTMDVGQYSTINIQKALAESIKGTFSEDEQNIAREVLLPDENEEQIQEEPSPEVTYTEEEAELQSDVSLAPFAYTPPEPGSVTEAIMAPMMMQDTGEMTELFFESDAKNEEEDYEIDDLTVALPTIPQTVIEQEPQTEESHELFAAEESEVTADTNTDSGVNEEATIIYTHEDLMAIRAAEAQIKQTQIEAMEEAAPASAEPSKILSHTPVQPVMQPEVQPVVQAKPQVDMSSATKEELMELIDKKVAEALEKALHGMNRSVENTDTKKDSLSQVTPPRSMQKMLSQEYDGQISIVVPDEERVEKQITGQIDIEEFLSGWENSKKQNQEKHQAEIKRRVQEQTGTLLTDFEAKARDGILEKLEQEGNVSGPIDADKEYEEYLKTVMKDSQEEDNVVPEDEGVEELTEIEDTVEEATYAETADAVESDELAEDTEELVEIEEPAESDEEDDSVEEVMTEESEEAVDDNTEVTEVTESEEESETEEATESEEEETASQNDNEVRAMTEEETAIFSQFIQTKKARANFTRQLDNISLASYVGNVFVTGETGGESIELAKAIVQYIKQTDSNFSGKIGKVSGSALNTKPVDTMVEKLSNGGLIIEKASELTEETMTTLLKALNQDNVGILVVMQDTKNAMNKLMGRYPELKQMFNVHMEIEELSDDALVAYGRKYAEHMEYSIDEMGILALHTRIDEMQTSDHIVTVADVRDIVDEAIEHATKFSPKHFTDVLFGKRYDDEDMIILKERDFIC